MRAQNSKQVAPDHSDLVVEKLRFLLAEWNEFRPRFWGGFGKPPENQPLMWRNRRCCPARPAPDDPQYQDAQSGHFLFLPIDRCSEPLQRFALLSPVYRLPPFIGLAMLTLCRKGSRLPESDLSR